MTYEKGESQSLWSDFLAIYGIDRRRYGAFFEYAIKKVHPSTEVTSLNLKAMYRLGMPSCNTVKQYVQEIKSLTTLLTV